MADALRGTPMGLAVHDHRIDGAADIVDRCVAHNHKRPGLRIDFDLADMGTVGKAELPDRFIARRGERPAEIGGHRFAVRRRGSNVENSDRAIGAFDGEAASVEGNIVFAGFEHMCGDFLALRDDQIGRVAHDDAAEPHRPGRMRAAALLDDVGVAFDDVHVVERHAKPLRHALRLSLIHI